MQRTRESTKRRRSEPLNWPNPILPSTTSNGRRSSRRPHRGTPAVMKRRRPRMRGWTPNARRQNGRRPSCKRPPGLRLHGSRLHAFRPNGLRLHGSRLHGSRLHALKLNGLRLNGLRLHASRPRGSRLHALRLNGLRLHALRLHASRLHALRPKGLRQHGSRPNRLKLRDGKQRVGRWDDSWTKKLPGVKQQRLQQARHARCPRRGAAHVDTGSSVALTPTRNSSCTQKPGPGRSS